MEEKNDKDRVGIIGIIPTTNYDIDDVDVPLNDIEISLYDICLSISSIIMHVIDAIIDISLAIRYLVADKITYAILTFCFIYFPSVTNLMVSKRMHCQDKEMRGNDEADENKTTRIMTQRKAFCAMAIFLQLTPVIHYYDAVVYALKARKCDKMCDRAGKRLWYIKMLKEDQDVALLRVVECFLEAAPQQILQIAILLNDYHKDINFEFIHQVVSVIISIVSMAWTMVTYNRSIRLAQYDKQNIGIIASALQFIWHFCVTVSRVLSISVVASIWPLFTGIFCVVHWMAMTSWITFESRGILEFCKKRNRAPHENPTIRERACSILFSFVLGIIHIFIYLNPADGRTVTKHAVYYVICCVENLVAVIVWIYSVSLQVNQAWYFYLLISLCIVPYLIGVTAMVIYYAKFHPVKHKDCSVPAQLN